MSSQRKRYSGEIRRLPQHPSVARTLFWAALSAPMILVAGWYASITKQVGFAVWSELQRMNGDVTWDGQAIRVIAAMALLAAGAASSAIVAASMKAEFLKNLKSLTEH